MQRNLDTGRALSLSAHLSGGLVGVMMGLSVLKNFKKSKIETIITYVAIAVYVIAMVLGVVFNARNPIPICDTAKTV